MPSVSQSPTSPPQAGTNRGEEGVPPSGIILSNQSVGILIILSDVIFVRCSGWSKITDILQGSGL